MKLDTKVVSVLTILLLGIAIMLAALGGFMDITGQPLRISKEHAWSDAIFLLGLAILLNVLS